MLTDTFRPKKIECCFKTNSKRKEAKKKLILI